MTSRKYWPAASSIASSSFISVTWAADEMLVFEWMGGTILTYRIAGELQQIIQKSLAVVRKKQYQMFVGIEPTTHLETGGIRQLVYSSPVPRTMVAP